MALPPRLSRRLVVERNVRFIRANVAEKANRRRSRLSGERTRMIAARRRAKPCSIRGVNSSSTVSTSALCGMGTLLGYQSATGRFSS